MKKLNNQRGFTLIEMLIVLLVISVLLIITVPNISKHNGTIREKGCEALIVTAQAQVEAYYMENNNFPTIEQLTTGKYLKDSTCPNGDSLNIDGSGTVTAVPAP
ncbi:competence type IV pilus major pilin ComGC [Halobacillus sp. BBL2006]|uniref:competence type IV pilus major pilin ComGC n=1 Tax=Halobacillus sp. BBL2006 TaxID=1543706 RepID=UPI0005435D8E|nr:competence type IV pilus major pilin ComGC [Halobacillus sp. BBL2006]KHE70702.1 competence protein ComG [Halobacillus sp. BBL2006]